jgi:hypothetical protein
MDKKPWESDKKHEEAEVQLEANKGSASKQDRENVEE